MVRVANLGTKWEFRLWTAQERTWAVQNITPVPEDPRKFMVTPESGSELVLRMRADGLDVRPEPVS